MLSNLPKVYLIPIEMMYELDIYILPLLFHFGTMSDTQELHRWMDMRHYH
jgi:hypothetical protein